jgi:hypothetical protein
MQRLLIRIFQQNLAKSAVLGIVLGGIVAAILGALVSGVLLAIAHALGQHVAQAGTSGEDLVDYILGIWPLHSPFRDSLQLFLIMHGAATHIQSVSGGTDFSNATVIEPLHGLLVIPALLLTLGGYIAASTDMQNRPASSLVRGAAVAIPYTILLLIMATSVNGNAQLSSASSSEVDVLNVDVATLIIFGLLWGAAFGLLGASLKLAHGQWRHLGFQYLRTSPRPLLSGMITGGLAAVGLAVLLSLLVVVCLLTYSAFALPLSGGDFTFGIGALSVSLGGSWQTVVLRDIAWGPFYGVNLFIFAFGGPIKVSCSSGALAGGSGNLCFSSGSPFPSISLFGGSVHLSPWIYVLLALPAVCLFLGGRVSVAAARTQGVGPAAVQGALIAAPFTVLMMLLTLISTFTFGVNSTSGGSNTSYTISIGASAIDLLLWALLSGAVFGALGGMYQVSPLKMGMSKLLFALGTPFRLLCKPVYFVFDRLSGLPPSSQRSRARNFVYSAFACALLLAIIAGVVGGLLIANNQSLSYDANRLIKNILYIVLIALPGLLLVAACAAALAKDPLESASNAPAPAPQFNVPTAYGQGVY